VPRCVVRIGLGIEQERYQRLIDGACRERGILPEQLTMGMALETLEALSLTPGLVGVTARFAKGRLAFKLEDA